MYQKNRKKKLSDNSPKGLFSVMLKSPTLPVKNPN